MHEKMAQKGMSKCSRKFRRCVGWLVTRRSLLLLFSSHSLHAPKQLMRMFRTSYEKGEDGLDDIRVE
jgi:hypothetical protein